MERHFKLNANQILQTMQAWVRSEIDVQPEHNIIRHLEWEHRHTLLIYMQKKLQKVMRKFGSTYELRIINPNPSVKRILSQVLTPAHHNDNLGDIPVFTGENDDETTYSPFSRTDERGGARNGFLALSVSGGKNESAGTKPTTRSQGQLPRESFVRGTYASRGGRGAGPALDLPSSQPEAQPESGSAVGRGRGVARGGRTKGRGGRGRGRGRGRGVQ